MHSVTRAYIDVVQASTDDLRAFVAGSLDPIRVRAQSHLAATASAETKLLLQKTVEDCAEMTAVLTSAMQSWSDVNVDARSRANSLRTLAGYAIK